MNGILKDWTNQPTRIKLNSCMWTNPLRLLPALILLPAILVGYLPHQRAQAQTETATPTPIIVGIFVPKSGEAVQGSVPLSMIANVEDLVRAELSFGYSGDPTNTWFLLALFEQPVSGEALISWDTTLISDGDYDLYLLVTRRDGSTLSDRVERVRVRNYSPIETNTPAPTSTPAPGELPAPTETPTPTITPVPPTSTPLPPNPAEITPLQTLASLGIGAGAALGALSLLGMYLALRRIFRRR
jgi:hypothetical protein